MLGYQAMRTCSWDRQMNDMPTLSLYLVGAGLMFKSSTIRCWGKPGYIHARISSNEDMFLGQTDEGHAHLILVSCRCWTDI